MRLFLCEKPSQGRDIAGVIGASQRADGYQYGNGALVTWCVGHLLELAEPDAYDAGLKQWSLAPLPIIPSPWKLEPKREAGKQLKIIAGLLKQASEVVIATDADREGEVIAREVLERLGWRGPLRRLWLSALDAASVRKALDNLLPGEHTAPLYQAGLGRARADWLVGMNLTRAFTLNARAGSAERGLVLSVGRVQTPTLKLVVDRDRQIEHFVPVPFWTVTAELGTEQGRFKARWTPSAAHSDAEGRCASQDAANALRRRLSGHTGQVVQVATERKRENPPLPHAMSSLQQEASRRFGLSAQQVLDAAQGLYEKHKATTYPRTDSNYLPESQQGEAAAILQAMAESDPQLAEAVGHANLSLKSSAWNDKKLTAHHAIIPTAQVVNLAAMSAHERQVYGLIRQRYLAQFYPAFEFDHTKVVLALCQETFVAAGRVTRVAGWKALYGAQAADEGEAGEGKEREAHEHQVLPPLSPHQSVTVLGAVVDARQTKPPARYTDGTLVAAMEAVDKFVDDPKLKAILRGKEKAGIGTDATRPAVIETLLKRGYLQRDRKYLLSTSRGRALIEVLPPQVADPATTALWEAALEEIAQGRSSLQPFLDRQAEWVKAVVEWVKAQSGGQWQAALAAHPVQAASAPAPRPRATTRRGRQPATSFSSTVVAAPADRRHAVCQPGQACPDCQGGALMLRTMKQGVNQGRQYLGCSQFPKCRHFKWYAGD